LDFQSVQALVRIRRHHFPRFYIRKRGFSAVGKKYHANPVVFGEENSPTNGLAIIGVNFYDRFIDKNTNHNEILA
jgi:hypothetical protein